MERKTITTDSHKWEKMKNILLRNGLTITKFLEIIADKVINDENFLEELENEND